MDEDDPNRRDAAARLASLLRDAGDYDDAVEVLRDTVRMSGANAKIYTELGLIYIAQKRLELAQLVLAKALELDAKDPGDLQRARDARAAPGQGAGGVRALRPGGVARRRTTSTRGSTRRPCCSTPATTREPRSSSPRSSKSDRTTTPRRSRSASPTAGSRSSRRRRRSWERVIKEAPKRSTSRADAHVEPRDPRSSTSSNDAGRRQGGSGALSARSSDRVTPSARTPRTSARRSNAREACRPQLGATAHARAGARVCARRYPRSRSRRSKADKAPRRRSRPTRPTGRQDERDRSRRQEEAATR